MGRKSVCTFSTTCNDGDKFDTKIVSEIIDTIAGHYHNYIQRALLSANAQNTQEAFNFLNKVQKMKDVQTRNSSNREPVISRPEHSSSSGIADRGPNPERQVYTLQGKQR